MQYKVCFIRGMCYYLSDSNTLQLLFCCCCCCFPVFAILIRKVKAYLHRSGLRSNSLLLCKSYYGGVRPTYYGVALHIMVSALHTMVSVLHIMVFPLPHPRSYIPINQPAMDGWCDQYHTERLCFFTGTQLVDLGAQVHCQNPSALMWIRTHGHRAGRPRTKRRGDKHVVRCLVHNERRHYISYESESRTAHNRIIHLWRRLMLAFLKCE